jgi:hypothetical protein
MKRKLALLSILVVLFLAACSLFQLGAQNQEEKIPGSGKAAIESRQVGDFSSVSVSGNGTLYIEQGSAPSLTITADDNLLPLLESRINGGKLILGPKEGTLLEEKVPIEYRVTLQDLKGLEGNGNIAIQAPQVNTDNLVMRVEGNSTATLSGSATRQEVTLTGNSYYNGQDLAGQEGKFNVGGNSTAVVNVSGQLDAEVSGNSTLEYIGSPEITRKVEGSGQVRQR